MTILRITGTGTVATGELCTYRIINRARLERSSYRAPVLDPPELLPTVQELLNSLLNCLI
jgi:hypothetical protein